MHNACNRRILSPWTKQICLVFYPWGWGAPALHAPLMDTPIAGHNGVQQACLYEIDVLLHRVYALLMKLLQSWRDFRDSVTSEFTRLR